MPRVDQPGLASKQQTSMREMGKNHNSVVVLRIHPEFPWMIPMGAKDNHTNYEQETQRRWPGMGVASGIPRFQKSKMAKKCPRCTPPAPVL